MKKILSKSVTMAIAGSFFLVGSAMAIPVYTGETGADFDVTSMDGEHLNPPLPAASGYYIWSDDTRKNWSVRWTGNNDAVTGSPADDQIGDGGDDDYGIYDWWGSIEFLADGISSLATVDWDGEPFSDGEEPFLNKDNSVITYGPAISGYAWDGFDFTLAGNVGGSLIFNLGSTLYYGLTPYTDTDDSGVAATDIYIGEGLANPDVYIYDVTKDGGLYGKELRFEVDVTAQEVPEPATMLLFGAGLVCLAGISRKKMGK